MDYYRKDYLDKKFNAVSFYKDALNGAQSVANSHQTETTKITRLLKRSKPTTQLNDQTSQGQDQRKDAVSLFPEEVWEKILEQVTDPSDLDNCSWSCQLFQTILKPRRAEWMFTKAFPFLYHHLDKASILNCRLSCQNWTTAVDNHVDQILSSSNIPTYTKIHTLFTQKGVPSSFHQFLPLTGYYFPHFNVEVRQDQLTYTSRHGIPLSKITPEMELSQRNPFLGRLVVFHDIIFTQQIVNQAIQLLENCGHHIWYLEVAPSSGLDADILKEVKRFFSEGLPKMPNLKKLDLQMTRTFVETHLLSIIQNSCKSLESLSISRCPSAENRIAKHCPSALALSPLIQQLNFLELVNWKPTYFEASSWPNLKTLELWNLDTPQMLVGLIKLNIESLKILKLQFCFNYFESKEDPKFLENLLQISNHFSKLTCLELVNIPRILETPENLAALPKDLDGPSHLSELSVHFKDSNIDPNYLTFLLRFPLLKNLYVKNIYDNGRMFRKRLDDKEIDMDIMGVYNALSRHSIEDVDESIYKAEIWKLLPLLEVLGVVLEKSVRDKVVVFTRQGDSFKRAETYIYRLTESSGLLPFLGTLLEGDHEDSWELWE